MLFINTSEGVKQVVFYLMEMLILQFTQTSKQCHVVDILMSISIYLVAHNLEMCALPDAFSCYMAEIYAPRGAIPGVSGVGCLRVPPPSAVDDVTVSWDPTPTGRSPRPPLTLQLGRRDRIDQGRGQPVLRERAALWAGVRRPAR